MAHTQRKRTRKRKEQRRKITNWKARIRMGIKDFLGTPVVNTLGKQSKEHEFKAWLGN